jgi:hypothetical protein
LLGADPPVVIGTRRAPSDVDRKTFPPSTYDTLSALAAGANARVTSRIAMRTPFRIPRR